MKHLFIIWCLLVCLPLSGQDKKQVRVLFKPVFEGQSVDFENTWYHLSPGDSVIFETFKCYISRITLNNKGVEVYKYEESYFLLNAGDTASMAISFPVPASLVYDELSFNIGIDSATNVFGAMGGALDPTKGMYWAWQSGYINTKLEGRSNLCATRKNEFHFHLGGYMPPYAAMQRIHLNVHKKETINIYIALGQFLRSSNLMVNNSIMIPGREAKELSEKMAQAFAAGE